MEITISIGKTKVFTLRTSKNEKSGWVRFKRKGFYWKHVSLPLRFSERNGYKKLYKIFNYKFGKLN
jgi:hypothetical protein